MRKGHTRAVKTFTSEEHDYCEHTGYCKRCGNHREYLEYGNYLCVWTPNTVSLSHLRAHAIAQERELASALKRLGLTEVKTDPVS